MHQEMSEAALRAARHIWLEKPMALTLKDAIADLVKSGAIGTPHAFRGVYDGDCCADPELSWSWRMTQKQGGLGRLSGQTIGKRQWPSYWM